MEKIKVRLDWRGKTVFIPLEKTQHKALAGFLFRQYLKDYNLTFKQINNILADANNIILAGKNDFD